MTPLLSFSHHPFFAVFRRVIVRPELVRSSLRFFFLPEPWPLSARNGPLSRISWRGTPFFLLRLLLFYLLTYYCGAFGRTAAEFSVDEGVFL